MAVHEVGLGDEVMFSRPQEVRPLANLPLALWVVVCSFLTDSERLALGLSCRRMAYLLTSYVGLEYWPFRFRPDGITDVSSSHTVCTEKVPSKVNACY